MNKLIVTAACAAPLLGSALAGCAQPARGTGSATNAAGLTRCSSDSKLAADSSDQVTKRTVVYLDTAGAPLAETDLETFLNAAAEEKAGVFVGAIGAPGMPTAHVTLAPVGNNDTDRTRDVECKTAVLRAAAESVGALPQPKRIDVFAALADISGTLTSTGVGRVDVVLDGNLTNNTPPADLTSLTTGHETELINRIAAAGLLPSCTGWHVTVVAPVDTTLRDFYNRLFERCGGQLVAWTPTLAKFPVGTGRLPLADRRPITVVRKKGAIVATLAGDVTFTVGKATLRPAAAGELEQVLALIPNDRSPIVIDGYTDDTGTDAVNGPLSLARANAILGWLAHHGVSRTRMTARGHGSASPQRPNTSAANQQANRRVTVTIYWSSGR